MNKNIDIDINTDTNNDISNDISNDINTIISKNYLFTCDKHKKNDKEIELCPPKYKCKDCKKRKISGYSNPDHCSNPFGYLYLAPTICLDCSNNNQKCRWC